MAGQIPPKVVITTSHDPSSRLQQFAKELRLVFPNSQRINRGNHVMGEIIQSCKKNNVTDLVVVHETRGVPGNLHQSLIYHRFSHCVSFAARSHRLLFFGQSSS